MIPESIIIGKAIIILLALGITIETAITFLLHRKHALKDKTASSDEEVKLYASRSLTLASITFAALAFLYNQFQQSLTITLQLLVFGFFLFLLSYKLDVFGGVKPILWNLQQRLFNYGLLSLTLATAHLFFTEFQALQSIIAIMTVLIIILHIVEFLSDLKHFDEDNKLGVPYV